MNPMKDGELRIEEDGQEKREEENTKNKFETKKRQSVIRLFFHPIAFEGTCDRKELENRVGL